MAEPDPTIKIKVPEGWGLSDDARSQRRGPRLKQTLPDHINPETGHNRNIIEKAILDNYPQLKNNPVALGRMVSFVQEGIKTAGLSANGDELQIQKLEGVIKNMENSPTQGEAIEIIHTAQEVALPNRPYRQSEERRLQALQAAEIAYKLLPLADRIKYIKSLNVSSADFVAAIKNHPGSDYLHILAWLEKKRALASRNPAAMLAAGIYLAAYMEARNNAGYTGTSGTIISTNYIVAPTLSHMKVYDYAAAERRYAQAQRSWQREHDPWTSYSPEARAFTPADPAARASTSYNRIIPDKEILFANKVTAKGEIYEGAARNTKNNHIFHPKVGEISLEGNKTTVIRTPAQIKEDEITRKVVKEQAELMGGIPSPDGKKIIKPSGEVYVIAETKKTMPDGTVVIFRSTQRENTPEQAALATRLRLEKHQADILSETTNRLRKEGVPEKDITPERIAKEVKVNGQCVSLEAAAKKRDEIKRDQTTVIIKNEGEQQEKLAKKVTDPKGESPPEKRTGLQPSTKEFPNTRTAANMPVVTNIAQNTIPQQQMSRMSLGELGRLRELSSRMKAADIIKELASRPTASSTNAVIAYGTDSTTGKNPRANVNNPPATITGTPSSSATATAKSEAKPAETQAAATITAPPPKSAAKPATPAA